MRSLFALGLLGLSLAASAKDPAEDTVRKAIADLVPGGQVTSVQKAPVPGFYEAVLGGQVVYVSADGKYVLSGALWDVAKKSNLTESRYSTIRRDALASVGDDKRIIYAAKNEKHKVSIFTDIDCGYCRKLHQEMAQLNDKGITVEYLFFPRAGVGTDSFNKAVHVWCAADRNQALTKSKAGETLEAKECANPIAEEFELGRKIGIQGTPAVIAEDGTQIGGYLPPEQMLARLDQLKSESAAKKAN